MREHRDAHLKLASNVDESRPPTTRVCTHFECEYIASQWHAIAGRWRTHACTLVFYAHDHYNRHQARSQHCSKMSRGALLQSKNIEKKSHSLVATLITPPPLQSPEVQCASTSYYIGGETKRRVKMGRVCQGRCLSRKDRKQTRSSRVCVFTALFLIYIDTDYHI